MVKAIVCHQHGGLDTLSLDDITIDPPAPGQVHIRIRAAGINFLDTLQISGTYQSKTFPPFTPGQEVAGDIIACGEGVDRFKPGDRVLATTGLGGYAEEVVAAAEWVTKMPDGMDYVTGAGFPITYGTSYLALKYRASLKPGETLLVIGAARGVGVTAIEIGKLLGARVIAAARGQAKLTTARHKQRSLDNVTDFGARADQIQCPRSVSRSDYEAAGGRIPSDAGSQYSA